MLHIFDFQNEGHLPSCITVPNFVKIGQSIAEILQFFKMAALCHLGFVWDLLYLDHTHRLLGGLYPYAKFDCNKCSSFNNMKVSILGMFGLKMPSYTKNWVFG